MQVHHDLLKRVVLFLVLHPSLILQFSLLLHIGVIHLLEVICHPLARNLIACANDSRSQNCGIDTVSDAHRCHRNSARHAYNAKETVESIRCSRFHRYTNDRERSFTGDHSRKMSRSSCGGDDDFEPFGCCRFSEVKHVLRCSVSTCDVHFIRNVHCVQELQPGLERCEICIGPHAYSDHRLST